MKLIQISDTHIVPPGRSLWGLDPRARLEACVDHVNAHHGDAELCIVTGDLTDRGEPEAYHQLETILARLAMPVHLMIGNHDDRDRFLEAFPAQPRDSGGFVQQSLDCTSGRLLLLDSNDRPGVAAGAYCEARAAWLTARLDEAAERPVYLFIHHPPFDIGIDFMDQIRLLDPSALARAIDGRRNIRHLFFGHVHRPVSGSWRGLPFSAPRSTVHQVGLGRPPTEGKPFCTEAPSYGVALLEADRVVVHHQEFVEDRRLPAGTPQDSPLP